MKTMSCIEINAKKETLGNQETRTDTIWGGKRITKQGKCQCNIHFMMHNYRIEIALLILINLPLWYSGFTFSYMGNKGFSCSLRSFLALKTSLTHWCKYTYWHCKSEKRSVQTRATWAQDFGFLLGCQQFLWMVSIQPKNSKLNLCIMINPSIPNILCICSHFWLGKYNMLVCSFN